MSTRNSSFLERLIRAITRVVIPSGSQRDGAAERKAPIRWVSLR